MAAHDNVGPVSIFGCLLLSTLANVLGAPRGCGASGNRWAERECSAVSSCVYGLSEVQTTAKAAALRSSGQASCRTPNQALEIASGTGRQFSIVRVRVRGRSQLFAQASHSRVNGLAIHIQKLRVAYFCFEERKG